MDEKNLTSSYDRSFQFMPFPKKHFAVISQQGYLYTYNPQEDRFIEEFQVVMDEVHASIKMDHNSYLLATRKGLLRLKYDGKYRIIHLDGCNKIVYSSLGQISKSQYLAGSWSQGVNVLNFSKDSFTKTIIENFPYNGVQNVYTAPNGDFIAATNLGVIVLKKKQFTSPYSNLGAGIIDCLFKAEDGNLYFSKDNTVYLKRSGENSIKSIITSPFPIPNSYVHHHNDSTLVGTTNGYLLLYLNNKEAERIKVSHNNVDEIKKDRNGYYWIKSHKQLFQLDFSTRALIDHTQNIPANLSIGAITIDSDSLLLVGTNEISQALLKYNYQSNSFDSIHIQQKADSISNYNCKDITAFGDSLLIGTSNGIYSYKSGTLSKLDLGRFSNDEIKSIRRDENAAIWLSISHGLLKIKNNETFLFTDINGIPSKTIGSNGIEIDNSNTVWIGTNNGVAKFENNIDHLVINKPFILNNEENRFIYDSQQKLELTHGDYLIFKIYCQQLPQNSNQYRFKLIRNNKNYKEWSSLKAQNQLILQDLRLGEYVLLVSAKNYGLSQWSDPLKVTINVVKPFYKRWYTIVFFVILLVIIIWLIIKYERNKSQAVKRKLEKRVAQRTKQLCSTNKELKTLNKAKDRILSIIAHDLRNPFNSILGMSELLVLSYDTIDDNERKKLIKNILNSSELTYSLLENLLVWTRVKMGTFEVNPIVFNINESIEKNIELAQESALSKSIQIKNTIANNEVYADRDMVETIIRNLLSDAIKFSPIHSCITFKVWKELERTYISITDEGKGMTVEEISIILKADSNYTTEGTNQEKGTGFGLSISKEFIRLNKGKFKIESQVGQGTTFTFCIPKSKP